MIISGKSCSVQIPRQEVAELTLKCLMENVPSELPGVVFLSGGQSDEDATAHLNIMNTIDSNPPWELSYSYGRALQASALKSWAEGTPEDSQQSFAHRAKMNSLARYGKWSEDAELEQKL